MTCSSPEDLAAWLAKNISKTKNALRKPSLKSKVEVLRKIFGDIITEEFYEKAARLAVFEYIVVHSRHYVNDSAKSWTNAAKFADWMREHGDVTETKLLTLDETLSITGLAKTELYQLERDGRFPARVQLNKYDSYWHVSEVDKWVVTR